MPDPKSTVVALMLVAAPSFGPAVVTLFGLEIPVLALVVSMLALLLARMIAPPSPRKLNWSANAALTTLLCVVLFLAVTGEITGAPLGVGVAVMWAIGLGFSGLLIVEMLANKVQDMVRLWLGKGDEK